MKTIKGLFQHLVGLLGKDKRIGIFLIFLMLSAGFWFINALRNTYISTIACPVRFINLPADKVVSGNVPSSIDLKVRGSGFSLLRYHFGDQLFPFAFDVSKMRRVYDGALKGAYLVTRDYTNRISAQLSNDIELMEMSPDTIYINFYKKMTRMIPVRFNGFLGYVSQYNQTGAILFSPDSLLVSGPDYILDTLSAIHTEFHRFENLTDTIVQTINLEAIPELHLASPKVKMTIPVEAITEAAVDVPIVVKGISGSYTVKTFPAEVRVSFRVGISQFDFVRSDHFSAVVDLSGIDAGQSRLKVKLERIPDFVYSVDYAPLFVDYLIEKGF